MIFYPQYLPKGFNGTTFGGPFIFIRPTHKGDEGLLEHEKVHVKQWGLVSLTSILPLSILGFLFGQWMLPLLSPLVFVCLYLAVPSFRLWAEVKAYQRQAQFYPDKEARLLKYAGFLSTKYWLKISPEAALSLLKGLV